MEYSEAVKRYDAIVEATKTIKRKGKTMPYTSSNGYMFSLLNKKGELGIRLKTEDVEPFIKSNRSDYFYSHGSKVKNYVLITEEIFNNESIDLVQLLIDSDKHINTLPPK